MTKKQGVESYAKGIKLENEFAEHMKNSMGYDAVNTRVSVSGRENVKGVQADIIGVKYDDRSEKTRKTCIIIALVTVFISVLGVIGFLNAALMIPVVAVQIYCLYNIITSRKLHNQYTWVECKNHAAKINIKTVRDFYAEVCDHNNSLDRKFDIHKTIFVSSGGFIDNALQIAKGKGIKCFTIRDGDFKEVESVCA